MVQTWGLLILSLWAWVIEIRAKAQEGIGRGLFCYLKGNHIYVLHAL